MRIISQNGVDLPYDLYGVRQLSSDLSKIIAFNCSDEYMVMAEYSTEEKAEKAMEMLHEAYLSRMELDGGYDMVHDCYVQPNYWVLPKIFQFPADEDVEV